MKTSALHVAAAVAMMTTASVSFAQQSTDANAPAYSGSPASPMRADTAAADRPMVAQASMNRNCAGLSDRQTEHACREGFPTEHADALSGGRDLGGRTDDQAD